jgi:uncharacterized membrane protein YtjA (UPF0391 family)
MITLFVAAVVIALLAGALGFTGISRAAGAVAKILFVIFLLIAAVLGLMVWGGMELLN